MLHRRDAMIRLGQVGLGAVTLPALLQAEQARAALSSATAARTTSGKAKSCILVYLWGGPPQQDMWDMKPHAPDGIKSEFLPIDTVTPGIQICDQMPRLAKHTDKLAIVRSMTHDSNIHEVGVYHTLTGRQKLGLALPNNQRTRNDFPSVGSVVSYFSPPGDMPATVTIPRTIGHDGVVYAGTYAGFLGPQHDPIEMQPPAEVTEAAPHSFDMPAELNSARMRARVGLLDLIEGHDRAMQQTVAGKGLDVSRELAFRMLTSPQAKRAFALDDEDPRIRDRYGRNEYGEGFLLARRLVEAGVRLVTIVWYFVCPDGNVANVWDNHGGTGSLGGLTGFQMLKEKYCIPPLDQGLSALLEDLSQRGLLDETLIAAFGEFGRTPKINPTGGREHWGPCQSAIFAGGGIQGGQVYGSSDAQAAYPKDNPATPGDILATMHHALGISADAEVYDSTHRPHRVTEGRAIEELF